MRIKLKYFLKNVLSRKLLTLFWMQVFLLVIWEQTSTFIKLRQKSLNLTMVLIAVGVSSSHAATKDNLINFLKNKEINSLKVFTLLNRTLWNMNIYSQKSFKNPNTEQIELKNDPEKNELKKLTSKNLNFLLMWH